MKAVIATATLDASVGQKALTLAQATAGIPCETVMAVDKEREGGVVTANRAWRKALEYNPDYLVYMNDDVRAEQAGWLARLIEALEMQANYGIAAPGGRCVTKPQNKARPGMKQGVFVVNSLSFMVVVIKRVVVDKLGLFDERYIHFCCDTDYCKRVQKAGWKCVWVRDVYLEHSYVPVKQRPAHVQRWKNHDMHAFWARWGRPKRKKKK